VTTVLPSTRQPTPIGRCCPTSPLAACPNNPRGPAQIKGNLYRPTTGAALAVHSGLVLITNEGALVIDPVMTCTAGWLKDEIKKRFNASMCR